MSFPYDLIRLITSYLIEPTYEFLDWIDKDQIEWTFLSGNPHPYAVELLKQNPDKIDNYQLSKNNGAIELIQDLFMDCINNNITLINWFQLCENISDGAIDILERNQDKIIHTHLAKNSNNRAVILIKDYLDFFENNHAVYKSIYKNLSSNNNDIAVDMLLENMDYIDWNEFSKNSNDRAVELLLKNQDKINWAYLSENSNNTIVELLKNNKDKINWNWLSDNIHLEAVEMLRNHIDSIPKLEENNLYYLWPCLFANPSIFKINKIKYDNDFDSMVNMLDSIL